MPVPTAAVLSMTLSKPEVPDADRCLQAGPVARETGGKGQHLPGAVQAQQPLDAGAGRIAAVGQRGHHPDCGDQQPAQPDAGARTTLAHAVHPVVPIPVPISGMPLAPVSAMA
jgi:hypothetical protein